MRILLVKLSSLGDVVHNFPVANDIRRAFPDAQIDWCVDAPYAPLVALHPAIARVFPLRLRALKNAWFSPSAWRDLLDDKATLAKASYDRIIDTQGLLKSAVVAHWARGPIAGFDRDSAREPLAAWFYSQRFLVAKDQHAVKRVRALASAALGYPLVNECDYGMRLPMAPSRDNVVFLHGTSRADKEWPIAAWTALGAALGARGFQVTLLSGSAAELARGKEIAASLPNAEALAMRPLAETAALLANAHAVVGVDTGLAHLAVALDRPTVGIYTATDPTRTGLLGRAHFENVGRGSRAQPAVVSVESVLAALDRVTA